jgi:hypothetical protein
VTDGNVPGPPTGQPWPAPGAQGWPPPGAGGSPGAPWGPPGPHPPQPGLPPSQGQPPYGPAQPPQWGPPGAPAGPPGGPGWPPGPPPGPPPGTGPERKKGKGLLAAVVVVLLVAAVGGGAFALMSRGSDPGADSPEAAVQELLDALEARDVLGVFEIAHPGERTAFRQPLVDLVDEAQRLGVLADDADLSDVSGYELSFDGVELRVDEVGDGISRVYLDDGDVSLAIDANDLPLGEVLRDAIGEDVLDDAMSDTESEIDRSDDGYVAAVEVDGRWYVSLFYTLAEQARDAAGRDPVDLGEGIVPQGSEGPEQAVVALLDAVAAVDLEDIIATLSPEEAAALYDYSPLFLDDAQDSIDEALDGEHLSAEVTQVDVSSEIDGDTARVVVDLLTVELRLDDPEFDEPQTIIKLDYDGECIVVDFPEPDQPDPGPGDTVRLVELARVCTDGTFSYDPGLIDGFPGDVVECDLGDVATVPQLVATAVRVDGEWYVSPLRSTIDPLVEAVRGLDDDWFRDLVRGLEDGTAPEDLVIGGDDLCDG